jgi:Fur family zinc uptake transcriptional regulator
MAHGHRQLQGAPLADAARAALSAAGERWTPLRAQTFDALSALDRPASAYEIAAAVSTAQARNVPANSIYRILDLFVATNLAIRVESANAYVVNAHPACRHDCLFLICDGCGGVTHLDEDGVGRSFRRAAEAAGFAPACSVLEMRGRCAACASA